MMLLCFIACLQAARAGDDITSAFNKAFLEQLGPNQGQAGQAIEIMQSGAGREAQLDRELQRMVSGPGYTVEVVSEDAGGMPAQIRQLFPGPLQFDIDGSSQPFREPDPLVMDMLSSVNQAVQEMVTPVLHQTQHASSAPGSCQKDAAAHCSTARSQVHCLGQHRADISDDCRRDLGKSVPFVCSGPIDKHCDVLHVGILDCLQRYQEELAGDCKDAFLATSKAIQSLNTAAPKAPVAQAAQVTVSTAPSAISKPGLADRERSLDSQLSKLTGLKVNKVPAATVASAIQKAEKQAEDQLAQDADKIESLLSQMSDKISKNQPPSSHWPSSRVMLLVSVLLLIAYFYFQSEDGRKAFLKLRMMLHSGGGRPFLKRNDMGFGEEVPL